MFAELLFVVCCMQSDHIWYCELCKDGGDLLLCDTCPKSFHKECLKLEIVPDGEWSCPICVSLQYSNCVRHNIVRSCHWPLQMMALTQVIQFHYIGKGKSPSHNPTLISAFNQSWSWEAIMWLACYSVCWFTWWQITCNTFRLVYCMYDDLSYRPTGNE